MSLIGFQAYETIGFSPVNFGGIIMKEPACITCNDTGVIETGNNDFPCDQCSKGDTARFYIAGVRGAVSGAEVKRHYLNDSPEPR